MFLAFAYVIVIWLLLNYLKNSRISSGSCSGKSTAGKTTIYWFHRPKCPHCVNMKTAWENLDTVGIPDKYVLTAVNVSDESNQQLAAKYEVNGVPHIIKVDSDGKVLSTYKGNRSTSDMKQWILS